MAVPVQYSAEFRFMVRSQACAEGPVGEILYSFNSETSLFYYLLLAFIVSQIQMTLN